jgi:hypothetical protein
VGVVGGGWWVWWVWGCGGVGLGGGFPLRSNIPRSALCATLDTYNFNKITFQNPDFDLIFKSLFKDMTLIILMISNFGLCPPSRPLCNVKLQILGRRPWVNG